MTDRYTDLDAPGWNDLFRGVRSSWFRLETLQRYDVGYETAEFEEFLRTGRLDRDPGEWQQMITEHVSQGRSLRRVHVVVEPLTDYLRYEFAAYRHNARAGEQVGIIATTAGSWPAGLPDGTDFWLFDDTDAWFMDYDPDGRFLAAHRSHDVDVVAQCCSWRDLALAQAVPLPDYLRRAA